MGELLKQVEIKCKNDDVPVQMQKKMEKNFYRRELLVHQKQQ